MVSLRAGRRMRAGASWVRAGGMRARQAARGGARCAAARGPRPRIHSHTPPSSRAPSAQQVGYPRARAGWRCSSRAPTSARVRQHALRRNFDGAHRARARRPSSEGRAAHGVRALSCSLRGARLCLRQGVGRGSTCWLAAARVGYFPPLLAGARAATARGLRAVRPLRAGSHYAAAGGLRHR